MTLQWAIGNELLANRVALVTGAARGMGLVIAEALGRQGAKLGLNDVSREGAEKAVAYLNKLGLQATARQDIAEDEWDFVIDNNLKNAFLCCRSAIPALRAAGGGSIVNTSSSAGKSVSTVGGPHYTAAKAGVLGLTRHLAREVTADGIRVNAVCPGLIVAI